ncbi:MAG: hypothetical protein R3C53_24525 [Pirellulaceae bacterium]
MCIFARKQTSCMQRLGVSIEKRGRNNGESLIGFVMGVEFDDFDRELHWNGMPRTHGGVVPLRLLNKAAKATFPCSAETNLKELASNIAALIPNACIALDERQGKLRKTYELRLNSQVQNARKRMAILAERRSRELRARKSKMVPASSATLAEQLNLPEILERLLKSKSDNRHELEIHAFNECEAHDDVVTNEKIAGLVSQFKLIEPEVTELLGKPVESGTTEHSRLPVNGVCFFVMWHVGWRIVYLAVSHEDIGLTCSLEIGVTERRSQSQKVSSNRG